MKKLRWVADPVELASDPRHRCVRRADRRRRQSGAARRSRPRSRPASRWSPPTRRCWRGTASSWRRSPRSTSVALNFEAAVGGAIPIVKTLREGLAGNAVDAHLRHPQRHLQLHADAHGARAAVVRRMPRRRRSGSATPRPIRRSTSRATTPRRSSSILASLAFGIRVDPAAIYVEGITSITTADLEAADELGYRIKLLGVAVRTDKGIEQRVHPTMVPQGFRDRPGRWTSPTPSPIDAEAMPPITLVGPGAGGMATASAVVADIADIARGVRAAPFGRPSAKLKVSRKAPMQRHEGGYYIRMLGRGQARHRRHHRQAARRSTTFRWNRSCSATRRRRPAATEKGQRSGAGHTDHLRDHRGCGAQGAGGGAARQGDFRTAAIDPHRKKLNDGLPESEGEVR